MISGNKKEDTLDSFQNQVYLLAAGEGFELSVNGSIWSNIG